MSYGPLITPHNRSSITNRPVAKEWLCLDMKYYLISDEHVAQVAEDLFGDNLIDHHTYTVFDEVVIGEAPVVQWHPITDQPIPKPANERQVLVLRPKVGELDARTAWFEDNQLWWRGCFDFEMTSFRRAYTHYCIIETPLPPTL